MRAPLARCSCVLSGRAAPARELPLLQGGVQGWELSTLNPVEGAAVPPANMRAARQGGRQADRVRALELAGGHTADRTLPVDD